jgi:uncharacterized MAPEG superfamily protein
LDALSWLVFAVVFTSLQWLPYVLERIRARGLWAALSNPDPRAAPLAPWAERARAAHANAAENLVLFAPLALAAVALGREDEPAIIAASALFGLARVAHYVVYTLGIPGLRTLTFGAGWLAVLALALQVLW